MSTRRPGCVHLLPDTHDAGAENQARYLVEGLRAATEMDLEIAYFGAGRAHDAFRAIGVPMLHLPRRGRFRTDAIGRARRLRRAYREREPEILHTWMLEGNVIGLLAARAWPRTKVVITQRGSWNELDYAGLVRMQRLLIGRADAAISNSVGGAEMLATLGMGHERISVIPNGIPAARVATARDRADVRTELGWGEEEVVVWVGRVSDPDTAAHKDLPTLLEAVSVARRHRPGLRLALVGPTERDLARAGIAIGDREALGWRPRPAEIVAAADLVALSSRAEGNSNVIGEALLLGVPVATTECGDHCGPVRRAGGRVVAVGAAAALGEAIADLLANPPDRADAVAAVSADLSVDRMVERTSELYAELRGWAG